MPFRIDIPCPNGASHVAPTQAYQDYLDDVEKHGNIFGPFTGEKYTQANLFISVTRQTISWSIAAPLEHDYTSQKWRNEVYGTAAEGHRAISEGCVGYYRGTNSLHVKRQHQTINEAAHNHNHYRFNQDVTPELFAQHIMNFVKVDKASTHNGTSEVGVSKFLTEKAARTIIHAFTECYHAEIRTGLKKEYESDPYYKYTREDELELAEGLKIEGECRDLSKGMSHTMAGLRYDRAEERQHWSTDDSVLKSRGLYQQRTHVLQAEQEKRAQLAKEMEEVTRVKPPVKSEVPKDFSPDTIEQLKTTPLLGFFNRPQPQTVVATPPLLGGSESFSRETISTLKASPLNGFFNNPNRTSLVPDTFTATVGALSTERDENVELPLVVLRQPENGASNATNNTITQSELVAVYNS